MRDPREYLIRKNGYFYRPNRSGYTMEKVVAGRYTKAEADREAAIEPENFTVLHESEVPDAPEVVDLKASNADLQAEILSLRQQVEKARAQGRDEGLEEAAVDENALNEAAWAFHDEISKHGPLTGRQYNNLKPCLRVFLAAFKSGQRGA